MRSSFILGVIIALVALPSTIQAAHGQVTNGEAGLIAPWGWSTNPRFHALGSQGFVPSGSFSTSLHADPSSLAMVICSMPYATATYMSSGTERYGPVLPNGVLSDVWPLSCIDRSAQVQASLLANDRDDDDGDGLNNDWNAGRINCCSPWEKARVPISALGGPGLYAVCIKANLTDASGPAGVFEDTTWFWHDNRPNNYALAIHWTDRLKWDGRAPGQDCSDLGIPV